MDAIASWQAVLTTLGSGEQDGDNAAARRAVAQALTPPPPAAGGGKEAFYTPLPAAQTGTPVDEWHSILTTLTGNAKAAQGRAAVASGSPAGSSVAASPAGSAAGQASPFGSASMVRQLFSNTPHSSKPEPASSSTGSTPRHGLPRPQTANGATLGPSPPKANPAAAAAHGCAGPSTALQPNPAAPSSTAGLQASASNRLLDTQHLADRLDDLRASAESVLQTVTQAAGSPAGKQTGHANLAATASSPRLSGGASSSSLSAAAGPQAGGALQRQLFQPAAASGPGRSSASSSTPASPLRRLLQSAQQARDAQYMQQQPRVPAVELTSTRMGLGVADGNAVQPQASHAQQPQQQEALQQLLLQQQQLIQQLLPLIPGLSQQQSAGGAAAPRADFASGPAGMQPQQMQQEQQQLMQLAKLLQAASRVDEGAQRAGGSVGTKRDGAVQLPGPAESSVSAKADGMQARAAGERGSVGAGNSSSGGGSDRSSSGRGQRGSGEHGSRRRRWQQPNAAGVADSSVPEHAAEPQQQEAHALDTAAGPAGASSGRGWTATGSKSLSAAAAGPAVSSPRFLSQQQHAGGSSTSSSLLAQALGLPQVVRFRGLHSTDGGDADAGPAAHEGGRRSSSSGSGNSLHYAVQHPAESAAADIQQAGTDAGAGSSASRAADDAGAAGGAGSADASEEPETPTAALPRVHTPGKPAAEVAADLSTPQLAHSAAAVMTVSEAWRDESSGANARWQQLLAEWSAAEVDTWGSQRLTEPSAVGSQNSRLTEPSAVNSQNSRFTDRELSGVHSQRSRLSSTPGLDLAQLSSNASVGAAGAPSPSPSQHRLSRASVMQHDSGSAAAVGWSSGGGADAAAPARSDEQPAGAEGEAGGPQQQEGEQHVTFASLAREQDLSPRRMPSEGAVLQEQGSGQGGAEAVRRTTVQGPGEAGRMSCETGAPVEADASEVSLFCPAPQPGALQQQQPEQQEPAANEPAAVPQHLSSPASPDTTRKQLFTSAADSCGASTRSSRSSSAALGAPAVASDAAALGGGSSSAATGTQPPAEATAAAATAVAEQSKAGPAGAVPAVAGAAGAVVIGRGAAAPHVEGEEDGLQQQEEEGLEKLSQLLHDLQGLQHRLQTIQLQSPRHRQQQDTAFTPDAADAAAGATPAAAPGAEAGRSALQSGSTASAAAAAAAAGPAGNQPARPGIAAAAAAALDRGSGGAATPEQAVPAAPVLSAATEARAANAVSRMTQLKQRLQDSRVALQALTSPRAGAAGATAAAFGSLGSQHSSSAVHATAGVSADLGAEAATNQAARSAAVGCAGGVNTSTAAAAAAPAASASAWLTGGSLQQYLERRSSAGRVSGDSRGQGRAVAAAVESSSAGGSNAGISHVQALVSKWRAAAAAEQHVGSQASQAQQQQQQRQLAEDFGLPLQVQSGPLQAAGAAQAMRGIAGSAHNVPEWLSATPAMSHLQQLAASRSAGGAGGSGPPHGVQTPVPQGPLGSAGRLSGSGRNSTGLRSTGSHTAGSAARMSMGAAPGGAGSAGGGFDAAGSSWSLHNPLFQHTPISTKPTASAASRRAGCYSSSSSGGGSRVGTGLHGLAPVSTGRSGKTNTRCSSTPPSAGTLTRWSQQGSPTRQLRQQLQATAQQFQLQQQERERAQQQWTAGLQVTPVAASLAKSFATVDANLAGLRSVSPARTATGARSGVELFGSQLTPGSGASQGRSASGLFGGAAAASSVRSSGRSAADILAGTAAAAQAEAARSSFGAARAQAASGRAVSPVRMLRRQQEMLASIGMLGQPTR